MENVYDPCQPLTVIPAEDLSQPEIQSIDEAIVMWNERAGTQLSRGPQDGLPGIIVRFEEAALAYLGIYRDEIGDIVVNRRIVSAMDRAITVAHELGHSFGLWHEKNGTESVMVTSNVQILPSAIDAQHIYDNWGPCVPPGPDAPLATR